MKATPVDQRKSGGLKLGFLAALSALLLIATSCGGAGTGQADPDGADGSPTGGQTDGQAEVSGDLKVWTWLDPGGEGGRNEAFGQIAEAFQADYPDVDLNIESQPWDELRAKFLAAAQTGNAPDVIWLVHQDLGRVDEGGGLADLSEVLSADFNDNVLPDLISSAVEAGSHQGEQIGLPLWPNPGNIMFYRDDLVDAAGLDSFPASWDGLLDLADVEGDWEYPVALPLSTPTKSVYFPLMLSFPSEPLDPETWEFDLLGEESRQVAAGVRELFQSGAAPDDVANADDDAAQDQFATGRFGAVKMYSPRLPQFKEQAAGYDPELLSAALIPGMAGGEPKSVAQFWTVAIAENSENLDAAAAFVEYLYTIDSSMAWAEVGGQVPDRKSALDNEWFETEEASEVKLMAELSAQPGVTPVPQSVRDPEVVFDALNETLQEIATTDRPIEEILTETQEQLGW